MAVSNVVDAFSSPIPGIPDGANPPPPGGSPVTEDEATQHISKPTSQPNYNWNIFRYIADLTHLAGICVLLYWLFRKKSVAGLSYKTQLLYLLLYVSRYLDLLDHAQTAYLVIFKITYIATSSAICIAFQRLKRTTYEEDKDTVSLLCIIVPCFIAACILTRTKEFLEIFWTFSEYIEGFAMVPQYVFAYRENAKTQQMGPLYFICLFGLYRCFYALNWMYKLANVAGYRDFQSWLGGAFEIAFFFDFLAFQFGAKSILRQLVLKVDDVVNETVEKMDIKVRGPHREEEIKAYKSSMMEMRQRRVLGNENYEMVHMQDQL